MTQIAIIRTTNSGPGDLVFTGVYGTMSEPADHGAPAKFTVAPEFMPVSTLFSYLDNGSSPIQPSAMAVFDLPDDKAAAVKDALMFSLAHRWTSMYKSLSNSVNDLMQTMIRGESSKVQQGIREHFERAGKQRWLVPVKATMSTGADGAYYGTEHALLNLLNASSQSANMSVAEDMPVRRWTEADASPAVQVLDAQENPDAPQPAWSEFSGFDADVVGHIQVMAADEASARRAAQTIIEVTPQLTEQLGEGFSIQVKAAQVTAVRECVYSDAVTEAQDWDGDSDDDDDGESDELRDTYRFR